MCYAFFIVFPKGQKLLINGEKGKKGVEWEWEKEEEKEEEEVKTKGRGWLASLFQKGE